MRNCSHCKKPVAVLQRVNIVVRDFYPYPPEKVEESHNIRINNSKNPIQRNENAELCTKCIDLVNKNGFLDVNKL